MHDEIAIRVDHVSKDFVLPHEKVGSIKSAFTGMFRHDTSSEAQHALQDISFEVKKGEFFGIVGRNGSGKSTMLKVLANIYQPTKGTVEVAGKLVPFIELGVGFNPELTGRENVYLNGAMLGFSRKQITAIYDDIVRFAELEKFMDQKLKNYSSGMQVRLAFSMATRSDADVLLVDEVLAVGDADFQRKCFSYFKQLKRLKKTVVFVSHDMSAVSEYCDRAILIEKSQVVAEGTAALVAQQYTHLFNDVQRDQPAAKSKRWGDKAARISDINIDKLFVETDKVIALSYSVKAQKDIAKVSAGFTVRNEAGQTVLGTNTKFALDKTLTLSKNDKKTFTWKFENLLNDGTYYIEPAVVYDTDVVADWIEEAVTFDVRRDNYKGHQIDPHIDCKIS